MTQPTFSAIRAEYVGPLMQAVSTESTRYYLNGFLIECHHVAGAFLVATDGLMLAAFHEEEGIISPEDSGAIVLPNKDTVKHCKAGKNDAGLRWLVINHLTGWLYVVYAGSGGATEAIMHVETGKNIIHVQADRSLIDGTFPDWRRVFPAWPFVAPTTEEGEPIERPGLGLDASTFNAKLIARFASCASNPETPFITIASAAPDLPSYVFTDRTDFTGIIMPARRLVGREPLALYPPAPVEEATTEDEAAA